MRVPTPHPPPGIIGQNRAVLTPHYCVFPPEGIMDSLLPSWPGCIVRFQTTPQMGARFAQALLILPPGAGSAGAVDDGVQAFLYVQQGVLEVTIEGAAHRLAPGGYAYVPQGLPYAVRNAGEGEARAIWVRKRYQPAAGVPAPRVVIGHRDSAPREDSGPRWRHLLLGTREMAMDFEMNIMCYAPGAHFWCVETHIMEHGMVMLQGQALQLLGRDWHELWTGDFVWMGPYVPQQIYAIGPEVCEYLLYKDVNRDVAL
ncbi:(S)-ureidoglycine aminohydrolase [Rubritepida flocculans]|jgi:(S)-ureidoglycine aminohydrolase|uniref:(S)-ureidoglycine aminohydrolase n=1 Tax=Rubritepida flocculans TaxID=182403 RepID=UPI00040F1352|nr:(S)-ureidoglycine aminohydrolase [Rubritepida flocculans]